MNLSRMNLRTAAAIVLATMCLSGCGPRRVTYAQCSSQILPLKADYTSTADPHKSNIERSREAGDEATMLASCPAVSSAERTLRAEQSASALLDAAEYAHRAREVTRARRMLALASKTIRAIQPPTEQSRALDRRAQRDTAGRWPNLPESAP